MERDGTAAVRDDLQPWQSDTPCVASTDLSSERSAGVPPETIGSARGVARLIPRA
jgi:hypothetical protein